MHFLPLLLLILLVVAWRLYPRQFRAVLRVTGLEQRGRRAGRQGLHRLTRRIGQLLMIAGMAMALAAGLGVQGSAWWAGAAQALGLGGLLWWAGTSRAGDRHGP